MQTMKECVLEEIIADEDNLEDNNAFLGSTAMESIPKT